MKTKSILLLWLLLMPGIGFADIIILRSGDKFESDQIREEGAYVHFVSRGREMRIPREQVERIYRTQSPVTSSGKSPGPSHKSQPTPMDRREPRDKGANGAAQSAADGTPQDLLIEDIRWGLAPEDIEGLVYNGSDPAYGGVAQYFRPDEDLSMGRADLRGIIYGFWQNRLYTITAWGDGIANFRKMRKEAFKRYGHGNQRRPEVERYTWIDTDSDRMLEFDVDLNVGIFWMRSRDVHRDVERLFPP